MTSLSSSTLEAALHKIESEARSQAFRLQVQSRNLTEDEKRFITNLQRITLIMHRLREIIPRDTLSSPFDSMRTNEDVLRQLEALEDAEIDESVTELRRLLQHRETSD